MDARQREQHGERHRTAAQEETEREMGHRKIDGRETVESLACHTQQGGLCSMGNWEPFMVLGRKQ